MEHLKQGFQIHHGKLRTRLISVRSLLHYLSYQVFDRGITLTPSYVRKSEVLDYLIDTYGSEKVDVVKSHASGTYMVDNYLMLEMGSKLTDDEDLKRDLDLLSAYFRTRMTEKNIATYLDRKRSIIGNSEVKPYGRFKYGRVEFKGVTDLSYHDNFYTVGNTKEVFVSHIFYDTLADYGGFKRDSEWTFRSELTREQEEKYISLILDGDINPNTEKGLKAHKGYMRQISFKTSNLIYEETYMKRAEELDSIATEIISSGKQLKGLTDYSIIYEDAGEEITHVPIYGSYYAWDYDNDVELHPVNRLRGIGGEFTRQRREDVLPYAVYTADGYMEDMYPVELESPPKAKSKLEQLQSKYADELEDESINKKDFLFDYWISADSLAPSGVPYLETVDDVMDTKPEDKQTDKEREKHRELDYVRVLNATDMELNGDVVVYMSNMFPKLNLKAQLRAVEKYEGLYLGSEDGLKLGSKTIKSEDGKVYIKENLKYYEETSNHERVVQGMLMLTEDFKDPQLYTVYAGETILKLSEDDLNKKRLGVYTEESESVYAYQFLCMFDTKTKTISRITDYVYGLRKQKKGLYTMSLNSLGLNEEEENALVEMVRKTVTEKVMNSTSSQEYYKKALEGVLQTV